MLGRLGTDALAAVGYTSQYFQLAQAALLALSVACVALMARALGAGEPDRARGAFAASLVLALGSARRDLRRRARLPALPARRAGRATRRVIERAVPYFRLTLGSTLLFALSLTIESALPRGAQHHASPLVIAGVVTVVKLGAERAPDLRQRSASRGSSWSAPGIATLAAQVVGAGALHRR